MQSAMHAPTKRAPTAEVTRRSPSVLRPEPLAYPCYSREEATARAALFGAFHTPRIMAFRDVCYRLTLESVGVTHEPAEVRAYFDMAGDPVIVSLPIDLAWRWLEDIAARQRYMCLPSIPLPVPLAILLIESLCRVLIRRAAPLCRAAGLQVPRFRGAGSASSPGLAATDAICQCSLGVSDASPAAQEEPMPGSRAVISFRSSGPSMAAYRFAEVVAALTGRSTAPLLPAAPWTAPDRLRSLRFACPISSGSLELDLASLRKLRIGDVLLPDRWIDAAGRGAMLILPTGTRVPVIVGTRVRMSTSAGGKPERHATRNDVARCTRSPTDNYLLDFETENLLLSIGDIGICAATDPDSRPDLRWPRTIAASTASTASTASAPSTGSIGSAPSAPVRHTASTVRITVCGCVIGAGELLSIAGRIGIRLTRFGALQRLAASHR